jgi:hypothetical protein
MSGSRIVTWRIAITSVPLLLTGAIGALSAQQSASIEVPPGPGLELIQRSCVNCHDLYVIIQKRRTPAQWADTLGLMADRGAEVTPDEMKVIEDYLAHNFALRSTP